MSHYQGSYFKKIRCIGAFVFWMQTEQASLQDNNNLTLNSNNEQKLILRIDVKATR